MRPGNDSSAGIAALIWGFAEATLFFLVPDVLLTGYAMRSFKRALSACLYAAAGAALGGFLLALLAGWEPDMVRAVLLTVPGISEDSLTTARDLLDLGLLPGLITASFTGQPYKTLAFEAAGAGVSPFWLALITPLARLPRFLLASLAAAALSALVDDRLTPAAKFSLWALFWLGFYSFYLSRVGW